ncbi:MAG: hypothetical protein JOZ83_13380 [Silvibacterium sp.]|nr:hypothetical protein [Silvibacterium sp.]
MAELETITPEEARVRLLLAYSRSYDGRFTDALRRPLLDPIEQRNQKGRRRVHPLAVIGLVLIALASVSAAVFSLHLWGE